MKSWIAVSAVAVLVYYYLKRKSKCQYEQYFSETFAEAREKFRLLVQQHQLEHHILPLHISADYTIDIAIIRGDPKKLLIHVSGTHGVEGFAGSAIQTAFLDRYQSKQKERPTLIFIHAMNPYGFATLRRWNENGVDLNRNAIFDPQEFLELKESDPNKANYVDLYPILNLSKPVGYLDLFWPKAIFYILKMGFSKVKKAIVSGNYHFEDSLFFGGFELQESHRLVRDFIQTHFDTNSITHVGLIDVHTGLGPKGFDSILLEECNLPRVVFGKEQARVIEKQKLNDTALGGYDEVVGLIPVAYATLFPNAVSKVFLTQEFGTVPGIIVLKALRAERASYLFDKSRLKKDGEKVRDVFYLRNDGDWMNQVIRRGLFVLNQVWRGLEARGQ